MSYQTAVSKFAHRDNQSVRSRIKLRPYRGGLLAFIAILAVMTGISYKPLASAVSAATINQPEPVTELYFNDPVHLPQTVTAGEPSTFSYHIANHEGKATTYRVRITQFTNGRPDIIADTSIQVADGQAITVPQTFIAPAAGEQLELVVDLLDQGESLHFRSAS